MKTGVLVISLEMPASQIIDRLVARLGNVSLRSLAEGVKTEGELTGMQKALNVLHKSDLIIRDDLYDIGSICSVARAMSKTTMGLRVLFVDYIQLVRCELGKEATREREVAEVSRSLRLLGLELGCLVIGITQLNEQGKARESRAIQQDATCIMAIEIDGEESRKVSIPFQRNGPCGVSTHLRFNGRTASFLNT
jgi:replicative DNA helicase